MARYPEMIKLGWDAPISFYAKGDNMDIPNALWNTEEAVRQIEAILNGGQTEGLAAIRQRLLDNVVGNLR